MLTKLFSPFGALLATDKEIMAGGGDAPLISPLLSDETVRSHWDTRALLHFSAMHSWVLIWGNTKTPSYIYQRYAVALPKEDKGKRDV